MRIEEVGAEEQEGKDKGKDGRKGLGEEREEE